VDALSCRQRLTVVCVCGGVHDEVGEEGWREGGKSVRRGRFKGLMDMKAGGGGAGRGMEKREDEPQGKGATRVKTGRRGGRDGRDERGSRAGRRRKGQRSGGREPCTCSLLSPARSRLATRRSSSEELPLDGDPSNSSARHRLRLRSRSSGWLSTRSRRGRPGPAGRDGRRTASAVG
jgi:hypothetical protein